MKNLRTFALAASLLAVSATAFAGNNKLLPATDACATSTNFNHKAYVSVSRPDRLNVIVTKAEAEPVKIRIKDENGFVLYRTATAPDTAMLPVNIAQLERGTYTVEFARCSQIETETFTVK